MAKIKVIKSGKESAKPVELLPVGRGFGRSCAAEVTSYSSAVSGRKALRRLKLCPSFWNGGGPTSTAVFGKVRQGSQTWGVASAKTAHGDKGHCASSHCLAFSSPVAVQPLTETVQPPPTRLLLSRSRSAIHIKRAKRPCMARSKQLDSLVLKVSLILREMVARNQSSPPTGQSLKTV